MNLFLRKLVCDELASVFIKDLLLFVLLTKVVMIDKFYLMIDDFDSLRESSFKEAALCKASLGIHKRFSVLGVAY